MSAALAFAVSDTAHGHNGIVVAVGRLLVGKLAVKPFYEDIREAEAECADGTPLCSSTDNRHDVTYWMWLVLHAERMS
jgi:hypothetical protein